LIDTPKDIIQTIKSCGQSPLERLDLIIKCWINGEYSNYQFLCQLNASKQIAAIPIFPSVISNWNSMNETKNISQWQPPDIRSDYSKWQRSRANRIIGIESPELFLPVNNLKNLFKFNSGVPAILFSQFESISENESLPTFAIDLFDFVYKIRKLLELFPSIPEWIQQFFGLSIPHRQFSQIPSKISKSNQRIQSAVSLNSLDFGVLSVDGTLFWGPQPLGNYSEYLSIPIMNGYAFYSSQRHFLLFHIIRPQSIQTIHSVCLKNVVIAADIHTALYLHSPSRVCKYSFRIGGRGIVFYQLRSRLVGLAVNSRFNVAVLLCEDGKVRIRCLKNGKKISTFDCVGEIPKLAIVSSEFGFVVCFTKSKVVVLTGNGSLIKWEKFEYDEVRFCFGFHSEMGIDYIGFVRKSGELCYFEVFYPEVVICVTTLKDVMAVLYDWRGRTFLGQLENGEVVAVSHTLKCAPIVPKG
jgi:hypothetical protein